MQAVRYNMDKVSGLSGMKKIVRDPFCAFLHKYYFSVVAVTALSIFAAFGVSGL